MAETILTRSPSAGMTIEHPALVLRPEPHLGIAKLQVWGASADDRFSDLGGLAAPAPGSQRDTGALGAAWLAPGEWLITGTAGDVDAWLASVETRAGDDVLVVDLSHARASFLIAGTGARTALAANCPLDLRPAHFPVGAAARSLLGDAGLFITRLSARQGDAGFPPHRRSIHGRLRLPPARQCSAATRYFPVTHRLVLRFRSPDQPGIMARIVPRVAAKGCDIRAADVFGDSETGQFFCRMELASPFAGEMLRAVIAPIADELNLDWDIKDLAVRQRVLIAVSKFGHCLIDLIQKREIGALPIEIVGVVSNHDTMRKTAEWHGLPYHHLPMSEGKDAQEARFLGLIEDSGAELTVLARYMQILSDDFSRRLAGRCINIHHSFLPSFKALNLTTRPMPAA